VLMEMFVTMGSAPIRCKPAFYLKLPHFLTEQIESI